MRNTHKGIIECINIISRIITEDPDVIDTQEIGSQPSSSSSSVQANQDVQRILKSQREEEEKAERDRQKRLKPEIDKITGSMADLSDDINAQTKEGENISSELNANIVNIRGLLNKFA